MFRDVRTDGATVPLSLYICSRRLVPFQARAMLMTERRRLGHAATGIGMPSVSTLQCLGRDASWIRAALPAAYHVLCMRLTIEFRIRKLLVPNAF